MADREFPTINEQKMDPKLYRAAKEGYMRLLTRIVPSNDRRTPYLTLCLTPQKNTVLHIAVEFEKQEIVQNMIELCPSLIYQRNSKGNTPLHVAARAGHVALTKVLTPLLTEGNPALEEGNPVRQAPVRQAGSVALRTSNLEGNNPIHEALKKGHKEVALHLLAFEEGHHEPAREVNMAGESLLYLAAEAGLDEVVQKIIDGRNYSTQGPDGQNPLHIAVIKGRLGVVNILRHRESNCIPQADRFGNTVLHYASARTYCSGEQEDRKQIEILQLLLKANPSLAYVPNINGDYPLFFAIRNDFLMAVDTILDHCPDSAELVNQKGQNALHLAVMEKKYFMLWYHWLKFNKLINEPDNDGNTPMHLAAQTNQKDFVWLFTLRGPPDLTMSNKKGHTAMDICGDTEREHLIRDILRKFGAVPGRHQWQKRFPPRPEPLIKPMKISSEFKKYGLQTLPIVTSLVAAVTFAAAFTVPGGYKNDGPREGLPVFMRNAALHAFVLLDILAFCSSMAATVLLVYANAHSEDACKIYYALQTCYYISGCGKCTHPMWYLHPLYLCLQ